MSDRHHPTVSVAILGASGFGGGELLRYLQSHTHIKDVQACTRSAAGKSIASVHPHLRSMALEFVGDIDYTKLARSEHSVLFAALPHGEFAKLWPTVREKIPANCLVIDLSADFRLRDAQAFETAYGYAHPCPEFLHEFQYLIPELGTYVKGKHIANPGCFATAIALSLYPLCGLSIEHVSISAMTGSSGSGASPSAGTHHPSRAHDFRAYKVLQHQHESEVRACLKASGLDAPSFSLVPHSAPMVRGIFSTAQFQVRSPDQELQIRDAFTKQYSHFTNNKFVHLIDDSPRVASVSGSNFAEISLQFRGKNAAVLCAIDNLGKGMAGQAIQSMNLALGLPAHAGIGNAAVYP
jgi:LysW-gamma-L-alpha-aminoadipyl-6-phosphate/LysW-L-glutamyl-5-phosphate reductase